MRERSEGHIILRDNFLFLVLFQFRASSYRSQFVGWLVRQLGDFVKKLTLLEYKSKILYFTILVVTVMTVVTVVTFFSSVVTVFFSSDSSDSTVTVVTVVTKKLFSPNNFFQQIQIYTHTTHPPPKKKVTQQSVSPKKIHSKQQEFFFLFQETFF